MTKHGTRLFLSDRDIFRSSILKKLTSASHGRQRPTTRPASSLCECHGKICLVVLGGGAAKVAPFCLLLEHRRREQPTLAAGHEGRADFRSTSGQRLVNMLSICSRHVVNASRQAVHRQSTGSQQAVHGVLGDRCKWTHCAAH